MNIIKPSTELIHQPKTPDEMLKHIELCGRVCYKSESKITPNSSADFIRRMILRGHTAVLEHSNIVFECSGTAYEHVNDIAELAPAFIGHALYLRMTRIPGGYYIVSGNARAWRDYLNMERLMQGGVSPTIRNQLLPFGVLFDDLLILPGEAHVYYGSMWVIDPDELASTECADVHKCATVRFICDRGVSHEIVRHRPASYCQESTRYCNYGGKGVTFIIPSFFDEGSDTYTAWRESCERAESTYLFLLQMGVTPQEARSVLPNSTKTEVIMTANLAEWKHFFELRTASAAHPQMREVATQAQKLVFPATEQETEAEKE